MIIIWRRLAAAAAFVLIAGTAGCGKDTAGSGGDLKIAYLATSSNQTYSRAIMAGFRAAVAEVPGVTAEVTGPAAAADPITQVSMFKDLTKTATGGVAFSAGEPAEFVEPLAVANAGKLPLAAVDIPPEEGSGVTLFIGNDNDELGKELADLVIDRLPKDASGSVVLGNPRPGLSVLDVRAQGVREQFAARLPNVKVKGPFDSTVRPESQLKAWTQLAKANPDTLGMLSVGADGAMIAKVRATTKGTWQAAAFDLDPASLAAVQKGQLTLMSPEHYLKGAIAGRLLAENAKGTRTLPSGWVKIAGLAVTQKNANDIIKRETSDDARAAWFKPQVDAAFANGGPSLLPLDQVD